MLLGALVTLGFSSLLSLSLLFFPSDLMRFALRTKLLFVVHSLDWLLCFLLLKLATVHLGGSLPANLRDRSAGLRLKTSAPLLAALRPADRAIAMSWDEPRDEDSPFGKNRVHRWTAQVCFALVSYDQQLATLYLGKIKIFSLNSVVLLLIIFRLKDKARIKMLPCEELNSHVHCTL